MIKTFKDDNYRYLNLFGIKLKFLRRKAKRARKQFLDSLTDPKVLSTLHSISRILPQVNLSEQNLIALSEISKFSKEKIQALRYISSLPMASLEHLANYARQLRYPAINRDKIASLVENIRQKGIIETPRQQKRLIVSLTSYPGRMYDIHLSLYSLLNQDLKPDKLILWLAEEQFPKGEADVPRKVLALKEWGLEIRWCPDYRSFKKLIPAIQEFPDDYIVTADDDLYYPTNWLSELWNAHLKTGGIVAHRVREIIIENGKAIPYNQWSRNVVSLKSSYSHFSTNGAGSLYPPGSLHPHITNYAKARKLCPTEDDIYIWGMAVMQGNPISQVENAYSVCTVINAARETNQNGDTTLYSVNRLNGESNRQLENLLNEYPIIKERLLSAQN